MAISVFDDYAVNINPDIILGKVSGGITFSNPDLEATEAFCIVVRRINTDGTGISLSAYVFVSIENDGSNEEILEDGVFTTTILLGDAAVDFTTIVLSDAGSQGTAITFEAFEDVLEKIATVRNDDIVNRTADRSTVMVFDRNTGADGVAPVTKITVPAMSTRTFYVGVITRTNADVLTSINNVDLSFTDART